MRLVWPSDTEQRVKEMRLLGLSWDAVGASFGVIGCTMRQRAVKLGLHAPKKCRRFTAQDDAILRADYISQVDLKETARKIGCSEGVLNQRIFYKHKDLLNTVRSQRVSLAVKRYGRQILENGGTAEEAVSITNSRLFEAKAVARVAALEAKEQRANAMASLMLEQIAGGKDRNAAIFEARASGLTLERISVCFGITRERIRQICDQYAIKIVMQKPFASNEEVAA